MWHSPSLYLTYFISGNWYLLISFTYFIYSPIPFPLATISLFSKFMSLFLFGVCSFVLFFLQKQLFIYLFIHSLIHLFIFERERGRRQGAEGEGDRENYKHAPCCQHGVQCGVQTHEQQDHDLSQNQESEAYLPEPQFVLVFIFHI